MLVLDIETVPLEASLKAPYPAEDRTPPANYKSAEAIERWRQSDVSKWEAERAKECSLNPRLGRVLCLGYAEDGEDPQVLTAVEEADEEQVLRQFWQLAQEHRYEVVTWNGSWDLRFLIVRSLYYNIGPEFAETASWFRKYSTYPHFDCKAVLLNWEKFSGEGLGQWAAFLGLPGKTEGINGADVYPLYCAGHLDEIADYCKDDVRATQAIYERIAPMFGAPRIVIPTTYTTV